MYEWATAEFVCEKTGNIGGTCILCTISPHIQRVPPIRSPAIMAQAEKLEYHYVVDNDPNLQYIRKLGSGGFGSVHEIFDIPGKKVPPLST
jgi:hypothetical protein